MENGRSSKAHSGQRQNSTDDRRERTPARTSYVDAADKLIKINRAIDSLYPLELEAGHIARKFIPQNTRGTVTSTGRLLYQGSKGECQMNSDQDLTPVTNDSPPKANLMCQAETPTDLTPGAEETSTTASQTRTDVPSTGAVVLAP